MRLLPLVSLILLSACVKSGMARVKALPSGDNSILNNCIYSDQLRSMPRWQACASNPDEEERDACLQELHHEYADLEDFDARAAYLRREGCDPTRR